jgi:hypothetical protein
MVSYQHIFSPSVVANLRGMVRDNSNSFDSNAKSTPIIVFQNNWFREVYFKGSVAGSHGRHEWKAGVESDNLFLHERFRYVITNPEPFDPGTPLIFVFPPIQQQSQGVRPDLEQSAFVQDLVRLGNWTISAGLRWDHYQLLLNQQALSPRVAVSRYFPSAGLIVHFSYDRIFETPSFENILLSSSPAVASLNPSVLRLPVPPSQGNYFEAGMTKAFANKLRMDVNYYRRLVDNYADDDQIVNTSVSFPISFRKAVIYGAEGKLQLLEWHRFSGFLSYSYMVGNAWFPVTGGLFLGEDATNARTELTGHLPDSQDQRNSVRSRLRYQISPRLWIAGGVEYGTGLPFDFTGTPEQALEQYGPAVVRRINFERERIRPSLLISASVGADVYKNDHVQVQLQADGQNLTNVLDLIDFGGLFSGNAIGPSRSYAIRLRAVF